MRHFAIIFTGALILFQASAREEFKKLTATFAELEARVTRREERSHAITHVKPAPGEKSAADYQFRINPLDDKRVTVQLFHSRMTGDAGEQYELPLDDAVKAEMARQAKLAELLVQDEKARQAENAKQITELSGGKLKFGMTEKEIRGQWGTHYRSIPWQWAGASTMAYDEYRLTIRLGHLYKMEKTRELADDEKKKPYYDDSASESDEKP